MLRVSRVETSTCVGSTVECWGTSRTSSNVRAVASSVPVGRRVSDPALSSIRYPSSRGLAMTFLVFFSAAARAWIVAPDLLLVAPHGLDHIIPPGARRNRALPRRDGVGRSHAG